MSALRIGDRERETRGIGAGAADWAEESARRQGIEAGGTTIMVHFTIGRQDCIQKSECHSNELWKTFSTLVKGWSAPFIARDTRCFNTCTTFEGLPFFGSLTNKCTCSGGKT